jgi:hypothetical protein
MSFSCSILLAPHFQGKIHIIVSNFLVWLNPMAGLGRPFTFGGLMMTMQDGLPFYPWSLASTVIFSAIFFGSYYFMAKPAARNLVIAER